MINTQTLSLTAEKQIYTQAGEDALSIGVTSHSVQFQDCGIQCKTFSSFS